MTENKEMELIGSALQSFDKVAAGLAVLEKQYKGVLFDVGTSMGMTHAKAARAAIREPRYDIERVRKEAKAPLLSLGKRLDAEATRITTALLTLETPIDEQIKEEENRKERERQEALAAEAKRVADIQERIEAIRRAPSSATNKTSAVVQKLLDEASFLAITETDFQEFTANAQQAQDTTLAALRGILAERTAYEAEQVRLQAEREELAVLRAEQQKREAAERERLAEEDRRAKAEREKELSLQRAQFAEEERVAKVARDAEAAKVAEANRIERERQAAEDKRLQDERERLLRDQEALRAAQTPVVKRTKAAPSAQEIVKVLALHYQVTDATVETWLAGYCWTEAA